MTTQKASGQTFGVVLLAAGNSSRLGEPKQLLPYSETNLLKHSIQTAGASAARPVIIVLGAHAGTIKSEIGETGFTVVINENWQEGMASSIRSGLEALIGMDINAEGVIIMVCDQPYVSDGLLNNLILVHQQTNKAIVTSGYEDTYGPPVLFHKSMFPDLLKLQGDIGARGLVQQHPGKVVMVPFPKGSIDIDTKTDYEKLQKQQ